MELTSKLKDAAFTIQELEASRDGLSAQLEHERERVRDLNAKLGKEKGRVSELWKVSCHTAGTL